MPIVTLFLALLLGPAVGGAQGLVESGEVTAHGRQLTTTTTVSSTTALVALITAINNDNSAVSKIILQAGTYEFSSSMSCSSSALCINRAVTIEAAVPGSVVLDAKGTSSNNRRVFFIQSSGVATLIGLNITGGYAAVACPLLESPKPSPVTHGTHGRCTCGASQARAPTPTPR